MSIGRKKLIERYLKCPNCGHVITLWAKRARKEGHIKTMNCYYCGKLVDMEELNRYGYEQDLN